MKGATKMTLYDSQTTAILDWLAAFGAAGLAEIAGAQELSVARAAVRIRRLERDGLVQSVRLLHGRPALQVITRAGLRAASRTELAPPRVSSSGFAHLLECGRVALLLTRALGADYSLHSERELRAWERAAGRPLASAELGFSAGGACELHRPDLVCWPAAAARARSAIAIEVELTVKAPQRLRAIVRGWARSRLVSGVVYYAAPAARRALERAVADEQAEAQVHVLELAQAGQLPLARSTSPIPRAP
jgi:DNA-binding MarR family transcriptional regulator